MADGDKENAVENNEDENENDEATDATAAEELARLEDQKLLDDLLLSNTDETGTTEDGDSVVAIEGTGYVMVVSEVEEKKEEDTIEEKDVESNEEEEEEDESESLAGAMEALAVAIDDTEKVEEDEVLATKEEEEEQDTDEEDNDEEESEVVAVSIDDTEKVEEVLATEGEDNEEEGKDEEETEVVAVAIDDAKVVEEEEQEEEDTAEVEVVTPTIFFATERGKDATADKGLDLETVAVVAGEIARDLLSVLRFGAANLLTKSLPDDQRQDLLTRMGAAPPALPSSATDDEATAAAAVAAQTIPATEERASIQEEIALARAEEAQKNEKKWERQKGDILSEMEQAANARVENELKIQKMKLEEETQKLLKEKDQAMEAEIEQLSQAIKIEKEMVEVLMSSVEEEKDEESLEVDSISDDDVAMEVDALFVVGTDEEEERNRELETLLEKRKQQQAALDSIEAELRSSVENEAEQRELLQSMLMKRQGQQEELNIVESKLRAQVKGIESEKARYQDLVAELDTVKDTVLKPAKDASSESAEDETDGESDEEAKEDHPVLGPLVADLGYKRIHFVSSGRLGTIPVWNRNRTYRNNRAKAMAAEKAKSMELGFPGVICLHEAPTGKLSIVDGQHRVGMMAALKETLNKKLEKGDAMPESWKNAEIAFEKVLVEVYPEPPKPEEDETEAETEVEASDGDGDGDASSSDVSESEKEKFAEKMFLEINKAEPVKLIDMPGVASAADRQIITDAVETLQDQFVDMFSPSQRCRIPNVNVDNLRSIIFGANILKRHKLTTSKKLVEWLMEQNAALGDEYESNNQAKQRLISKKQWAKASGKSFYLGLESSWLYK